MDKEKIKEVVEGIAEVKDFVGEAADSVETVTSSTAVISALVDVGTKKAPYFFCTPITLWVVGAILVGYVIFKIAKK